MNNTFKIFPLDNSSRDQTKDLFRISIPLAFAKEGLSDLTEAIRKEIDLKEQWVDASLDDPFFPTHFLIAKKDELVVGTISYGPCGEDIIKCTKHQFESFGEVGSLYVSQKYQDQGLGSALIQAMMKHLIDQNITQFVLDSGYQHAQKKWLKKFGEPFLVVEDYWGQGLNHMIWHCEVKDILLNQESDSMLSTSNSFRT